MTEMDHLVETMRQEGLCSSVHYKEMYINQEAMEGDAITSHPNLAPFSKVP